MLPQEKMDSGLCRVVRVLIMVAVFSITAALEAQISTKGTPRQSFINRTVAYKVVGKCTLQADVYRSPDNRVRPLIFWIHGGALIAGYRGDISPEQLQRYIDAGFAVISIDYRLAPETKLPQILEDVRDAYSWARTEGPKLFRIDPDRIAVIGHSAGGYLTLASGYYFHPRPRALVSFYGYGDVTSDWYSKPDPHYSKQPPVSREQALEALGDGLRCGAPPGDRRFRFYLYCRQQGLWPREVAGIDPHTNPKAFDPFCPVRNVSGDYPPTVLLHGDKDDDVPFEQSEGMYNELKQRGVECEFFPYVGGGHGFDKVGMKDPRFAADFNRVIAFLKKHLD
jgi:acetyl esterase/lipase